MYFKSITIEGFECFGNRTVINGFDSPLNVITGFNDKSTKIFDFICFALGLTNWSQVKINELISKSRPADINKATVTITFSNTTGFSPVGYETQKEISITRVVEEDNINLINDVEEDNVYLLEDKNVYLVNGVKVKNSHIRDLLANAHLNIHYPHFLIAEGQITKVSNMKPLEILSMIGDAVGVNVNGHKEFYARDLMKKESILREIDTVLSQDIYPKLNQLKFELDEYAKFIKIAQEHETLSKLYVGWKDPDIKDYLMNKQECIEELRKCFGVSNSDYDLKNFNIEQILPQINQLEETKQRLKGHVNRNAEDMLASVEDEFNSLTAKRDIVLRNKQALESLMESVVDKKLKSLRRDYNEVNRDFRSILDTLLPGTIAKLVPLEGKTELEGLKIQVAVEGIWKESLDELSTGERSLVALSLILALLKWNPAPVYIFDKVDDALDSSLTQNFTKVLKLHFPSAQFVLISPKDGIFNDANVTQNKTC